MAKKDKDLIKQDTKEHAKNLHPLKFNILDNPFFNYAGKEDNIKSIKRLVNLEIMLTVIIMLLVLLLIFLYIQNPDINIGGSASTSPTPTTVAQNPTQPSSTTVPTIVDNRGNSDNNGDNGGTSDEKTKIYVNNDLGFTLKVPVSWKLTETEVKGVKNTLIEKTDTTVKTYISFQSRKPDGSEFESQGTYNLRDIYTSNSIFRAEGYVKFGNALWASFKVDNYYIVYAGNVITDIEPVLRTFSN